MRALGRIAAVLAVLAMAASAVAQDSRGRVQGTVVDTSGGAMPGVSVTLTNDATGIAVTRQTGPAGRYLFDQVDIGTYTITAEIAGFATLVQKNVRMPQRGDVTADLTLKVSTMEETVTVEESPVAVQFNTSARDLTVEGDVHPGPAALHAQSRDPGHPRRVGQPATGPATRTSTTTPRTPTTSAARPAARTTSSSTARRSRTRRSSPTTRPSTP